ncbi:MAG: DUF1905 domain-containing protein [Acidobacteriaceae bacterium]|nr:DUF1905 domain-containing protein [Acidobacteriaceae bacterium]MBV9764497.1 DUF1905 domain-containing protein [Acidobacteriaceae bacterium]
MKRYKFKARIEEGDRGGAYVLFPYDVEKEFGTKGRVPVKATFNGVEYTGSLMKYGHPQHMLGLLKSIREQMGADIGSKIEVEVWKDESPRTVPVPAEFQKAMRAGAVSDFFDGLSYTHRKEYCRWITEAKTEQTREKRMTKAIEMLKKKVKSPDAAS